MSQNQRFIGNSLGLSAYKGQRLRALSSNQNYLFDAILPELSILHEMGMFITKFMGISTLRWSKLSKEGIFA